MEETATKQRLRGYRSTSILHMPSRTSTRGRKSGTQSVLRGARVASIRFVNIAKAR